MYSCVQFTRENKYVVGQKKLSKLITSHFPIFIYLEAISEVAGQRWGNKNNSQSKFQPSIYVSGYFLCINKVIWTETAISSHKSPKGQHQIENWAKMFYKIAILLFIVPVIVSATPFSPCK